MPSSVIAPVGFFPPDRISADEERPGLLRAAQMEDPDNPAELDFQRCQLNDWSVAGAAPLDLYAMGFDSIDLGPLSGLQSLLADIRRAGEISADDARQLRRRLSGQVFRLGGGQCVRLLFIAPEGLIMRTAGPNGLEVDPERPMSQMNGHKAANAVHGDQDVKGTPLKQIMRGMAPWLFRHETPDGGNRLSPLLLINLWIPLDQLTRPLILMDRRTLDQRRHQLRYALPTDGFLEREEDRVVNDIWTFVHDDAQRWYFHSDMGPQRAYVFDTLGAPHGSAILPGEEAAEQAYLALQSVSAAVRSGNIDAVRALAPTVPVRSPQHATDALTASVEHMQSLLQGAADALASEQQRDAWLLDAQAAMARVVRKSLEMRVVAVRVPAFWPFYRA